MTYSHIRQHMMLVALPLLVLRGASAARAADDEMAPRGWMDPHTHQQLPAAYGRRGGPAVYGWSYRAHVHEGAPAAYRWSGCHVYHYWNGEECVDARDIAPKY